MRVSLAKKALASLVVWLVAAGLTSKGLHARPNTIRFGPSLVTTGSSPRPNAAALFVGEYRRNDTVILDRAGHELRRIDYYGALALDREGNLYIANSKGATSVRIYAPPYDRAPTLVTPGDMQKINAVVVDQKTDVFAIMTQANYSSGGPGQLRFYRHGQTKPCRVVPPQNIVPTIYNAGAFDAEDTFFFAADNGSTVIASTPGDCSTGGIRVYSFGNSIEPYGNFAFNASDNFVIQGFVRDLPGPVFTYGHPVNGSFGQPLAQTHLPSYRGFGSFFLALDTDVAHLWGSFLRDTIKLYDYPAGGRSVESIDGLQEVNNMALFPSYVP